MLDTFVMTRLEQLRALADPLRLQLVERLAGSDGSVAELAAGAEVPMTRLYHHVDLLLEAGLIEVVDTVRRRGTAERRFRAVARRYTIHGSLLEMAPGPDAAIKELLAMSRSILGGALEALTEGLENGTVKPGTPGRGLILQDRSLRLSAEAFQRLAEELPAWLEDFARRHRTTGGASYRLAAAVFPAEAAPSAPAPRRSTKRKVR